MGWPEVVVAGQYVRVAADDASPGARIAAGEGVDAAGLAAGTEPSGPLRGPPEPWNPTHRRNAMNTRTMAMVALVIAVLLLLFLVILPRI